MRIPWPLVALSAICSIALTWFLGTRNHDFLTPAATPLPDEDFGADLIGGIPKVTPTLLSPPKPPPKAPATPKPSTINDADLGDLAAAPGLDHYRDFARREKYARTLDLSSKLQAIGLSHRAILALERVIDSTEAPPADVAQAAAGITALTPSLPQWNVDPSTEVTLTLRLGCSQKAPDSLKTAALEVATQIRQASGDQLEIIPMVTSGQSTVNSTSVTLQITSADKTDTPVLTLTTLFKENSTPTDELAKAAFRMVRTRLSDLGYPMPDTFSPKDLSQGVTRLMWRDYANSLTSQPTEQAPLPSPEKQENPEELY